MNHTKANEKSKRRNEPYDFLVVGSGRGLRPHWNTQHANIDYDRFGYNCHQQHDPANRRRRLRGWSGFSIIWLAIMLGILGLMGCSRQAHLRPEEAYRDARAKFERGELVQALDASDEGFRRFEKSRPDWAWRFRVLKAEVLVWQGKSKESLALVTEEPPQSLSTDEAVVRRKVLQSVDYYYLQQFDSALRCLDEAEQLAKLHQPQLLGEIASVKGRFATVRRDYSTGETLFRQALRAARQQNQKFLEANALGNLGWNAMLQEHYDEAIDLFTNSLITARGLGNESLVVRILGNLGWCFYKLGDYERSASMYDESEKLAEKLGLLNDQQLRFNNIGLIRYQQRDFAGAELSYKQALTITRRLENKLASAMALNNLAAVALESKQYDLADNYNREAMDLERSTEDKTTGSESLINQGRILGGRKQFPAARQLFQQVINDSGEDVSLRWEVESELGRLYASQGNVALADAQYRRALSTIDQARASLPKEEHRLSFLTTATRFYNDYIDFLIAQKRTREALQVAEHSRARTLAEGLKLPPEELRRIAVYPERSAKKLDAVILEYWLKPERSYLWAVTPSRVELYTLPGQDEIEGAVQEYRKALLGPRDVRETASASGLKLYEMLVAPAEKLIRPRLTVQKQDGVPGGPKTNRRGRLSPQNQGAPRVVIIADGALHTLNFETLLVPGSQSHYWIEDVVVSNASSIALLGAGRSNPHLQQRQMWGTEKLLLIGDPNYAGTDVPALSQAKIEVQKVKNYFPELKRVVVEGRAATPSAYETSNAGQFGYIHFVAHGTASRISPLDSSIVLSREGDAYKLYARDIMQKPLRADLVTISACYGAGNRAYSGEGLVGLSWAFLRAGAHNVIAALWEVNDASTPQLMDGLYSGLSKGQNPAQALRVAKLAMLHSDTVYRRPFYWGAFQIYVGS